VSGAEKALFDEWRAAESLVSLFRPHEEPASESAMVGALVLAVTLRRIRMLTEE
jgi:hypothetical protein